MTASPTSSSKNKQEMIEEIERLSKIIDGKIIMPIIYRQDFESFVNRPPATFYVTQQHPDQDILCKNINNFIIPFMRLLNSTVDFNSIVNIKDNSLRSYLRNLAKDFNIKQNFKQLQITNFLQMILSGYELMQIFGTKKAVEFLREKICKEFEKNQKNKVWSETEIKDMVIFIDKISNLEGSSAKLEVLEKLLLEPIDQISGSRILIFVKARKTARLLKDHLYNNREIRRIWQPKYCTGQANGDLDGMTWREDQEPIIQSFNQGDCKLLVATSVLQEGLDVQICNKVIIFDTLWNLTQFVQSRGRARHHKSKFIIIDSLKNKKIYENLIENEQILINLVKSIAQDCSNSSLIQKQIDLFGKASKTTSAGKLYNVAYRKHSFYFQIYLIAGQFVDLFDSLKKCKGFLQCEPVTNGYIGVNMFEKFECFNVLFEINCGKKQDEKIWNVLNNIKFILSSKSIECIIYTFGSESNLTSSNFQCLCESMELGNLSAPNEFYTNSKLKKSKLIIDFQLRTIKFLIFINSKLYKLEFEFEAIDHLISFYFDKEHVYVYIPFKQAPFVFVDNSECEYDAEILKNLVEEYLPWERTCLNISQLSVKMEFFNEEKNYLIEAFKNLKGVNLFFANVKNLKSNYSIENLRRDFKHKNFSTYYCLEVFISQNYYILEGKINENIVTKLNILSPYEAEKILEYLNLSLKTKRFLNMDNLLEQIIQEKSKFTKPMSLNEDNLKISFFRQATITPSRTIFYFPEPNLSNRVTRQFGEDNFIIIRFRDEDLVKINMSYKNSDMKDVYLRIRQFLNKGLTLLDRKYTFLAMSSSQLRGHGCWLFNSSYMSPDRVRSWMGDFKSIRCIGKYAARLGQSLSSSIETFETKKFSIIDDIKVGDYCFTDGIGKISVDKAMEISKEFYGRRISFSAFQIRFGGFKGVVAMDPNLMDNELQFRNSMRKFDSGYNRLDVINVADYIPCFLNRQIILILSSLGIEDSIFEDLQDDMLKHLSNLLIDRLTASLGIMKYYRSIFSDFKHSENLSYCLEPFFRDLLKAIYQKSLNDLIKKSRIFIQKGRILMGIIDETGKLNHDEVFIQCSQQPGELYDKKEVLETKNGNIIVQKNVIIAKNPCMHPGDVRVLKAVDVLELRHIVDCVVFPSVGPRPITNMCSGSDLDGDLYFVSWEPRLIPKFVEEPMNYISPKAAEKDSEIKVEDVVKFFVDFIEMDQLGRIANAHVAISDQSKQGVKDPLCIRLAETFSLAVDFPKTGVVAELPSEIKNLKYPDFMEKIGPSYYSEKIIGKLYRKCKKIFNCDTLVDQVQLNYSFLVNGYEKYVPEAKEIYSKYRTEIKRIMNILNCNQESELFVGIYFNSNNSKKAKRFFQISCFMVKKLRSNIRNLFNNILDSEKKIDQVSKTQIASAWYYACYSSEENKKLRILSFPWILEDVLNLVKIQDQDIFFNSIANQFCLDKDDFQKVSRFTQKIGFKKQIQLITGLKLVIVGSLGLFLFEQKDDLQMVVYNCVESQTLDGSIADKLEEHFDNVYCHEKFITCTESEEISFSLIESNEILKKFIYLRRSIFLNPEILPVFYFAAHFAREDDLFLKLNSNNVKLLDFLSFYLDYLIEKKFVSKVAESEIDQELIKMKQDESLFDCLDEWTKVHDYLDDFVFINEKKFAKMVINFYQDMAFGRREFYFKTKNNDQLNEILISHFYKVFDRISKTLDVSDVWNSLKKTTEPVLRQRFCFARKKGKSPSLFVENASLLLFSNYQSDFDLVEFELYKGKRRSLHLSKECYTAKINRHLSDFTHECFKEFYRHSITQFNKAREMKSDYTFRIQLKFGDSYFTNVPSIFENSSTLVYGELKEALKKGYKKFQFSFFKEGKSCVAFENTDNEDENYDDDDDEDLFNDKICDEKKKEKKKRKRNK